MAGCRDDLNMSAFMGIDASGLYFGESEMEWRWIGDGLEMDWRLVGAELEMNMDSETAGP